MVRMPVHKLGNWLIVFTSDHVHTEDTQVRVTALYQDRQFLRHISISGHKSDETCRFRRLMAFIPLSLGYGRWSICQLFAHIILLLMRVFDQLIMYAILSHCYCKRHVIVVKRITSLAGQDEWRTGT